MITSYDDRRTKLARAHHLVEGEAQFVTDTQMHQTSMSEFARDAYATATTFVDVRSRQTRELKIESKSLPSTKRKQHASRRCSTTSRRANRSLPNGGSPAKCAASASRLKAAVPN